jgi:hypothetical protein
MMFRPKYFELYEMLPESLYNEYFKERGEKLWALFDERLLRTMDHLRERYGPLVANDWKWGGGNQYRGWRPTNSLIGATFSQHKYGRAGDLKPVNTTAAAIRGDILNAPNHPDFQFITGIEMNVSWLHISVQNWNKRHAGIKLMYP